MPRTTLGLAALALLAMTSAGCRNRGRVRPPDRRPSQGETAQLIPTPAPATQPVEQPATQAAAPAAPRVQPLASSAQPPTGRPCRVQFRRDALGLAAPMPLGLTTVSPASRVAQMDGTIDQVSDDWLVLRADGRLWWIPRDVILAVEFPEE